MSYEEKKEYEELKSLLYTGTISQYGKRKLIDIIEKQQKEIEELKDKNKTLKNLQNDTNGLYIGMIERKNYFERELQKLEDKIKAMLENEIINISGFECVAKEDVQSLLKE